MEKEFVNYEQALALKELGFGESCIYHYKKNDEGKHTNIPTFETHEKFGRNHNQLPTRVSAPIKQQVFRWFRDSYSLFGVVNVDTTLEPKFCYSILQYNPSQFFELFEEIVVNSDLYYSYEEAESACIDKLIETLKTIK